MKKRLKYEKPIFTCVTEEFVRKFCADGSGNDRYDDFSYPACPNGNSASSAPNFLCANGGSPINQYCGDGAGDGNDGMLLMGCGGGNKPSLTPNACANGPRNYLD